MTHYVRANAAIECAQCGRIATGVDDGWRLNLPATPAAPVEPEDGGLKVTDFNHSGAALRRVLDKADADKTSVVIVLQSDGAVSAWGCIDGDDQSDWFDRRIGMAKSMLTKGR